MNSMDNNQSIKKPTESINRIVEAIAPKSKIFTDWRHKKYLDVPVGMLLILVDGNVDIFRGDDHLYILSTTAPTIFGLANSNFTVKSFSAKPSVDAKFLIISYENASNIFYEMKLWQSVTEYMNYRSEFLIKNQQIFIRKTAREIISLLILDLMQEHTTKSLSSCIVEKTVLSRSMVMNELRVLRKENIIKMKAGKLISVDENLLLEHTYNKDKPQQ